MQRNEEQLDWELRVLSPANVPFEATKSIRGETMKRFISIHRAPGLSREEFARNAEHVFKASKGKFQQSYVNLAEGFIVTIFEADSRDELEEQFEELGFPFDEIHELQFAQSRTEMEGMLRQMGKI